MATFRNPLLRHTYLPIKRSSGDMGQEIIIENSISQKREIRDLEYPQQLDSGKSNTHMFRTKTRQDAFRDVTIKDIRIVGRLEKFRNRNQPSRYRDPRVR